MNDIKMRRNAGKTAGIIGIVANIFLFAVKVCVGLIAGSISVVADAINNLSDAGSSVFLFIGYHVSGKPADREHPYGHARAEYLSGLFISVIITVLGIELLRDSLSRIFSKAGTSPFSTLSVVIMSLTVLVKLALAVYYRRIGNKIDSDALRASSVDSIGDMFATGAVVAGMLLAPITGPYTDAVLGLLISVYIISIGIKLVMDASNTLMGKAPDRAIVDSIVQRVRSYEGVLGIHDLVLHSYGSGKIFASIHVEVDADGDIMALHDLCDNIENDFCTEGIIDLVIHMDPVQRSDPKVNQLRAMVGDIVSHLSAELGSPASMHDFRAVIGATHSNLIFDIAVTDEFPISNKELSDRISEEIKKQSPLYNAVITVDRDYTTSRFGKKL